MRVTDVRLVPWNRAPAASVQLHAPDETPIAALAWTGGHPGQLVLRQVAPLFVLGMVALLISAVLLAVGAFVLDRARRRYAEQWGEVQSEIENAARKAEGSAP